MSCLRSTSELGRDHLEKFLKVGVTTLLEQTYILYSNILSCLYYEGRRGSCGPEQSAWRSLGLGLPPWNHIRTSITRKRHSTAPASARRSKGSTYIIMQTMQNIQQKYGRFSEHAHLDIPGRTCCHILMRHVADVSYPPYSRAYDCVAVGASFCTFNYIHLTIA